MQQGKLGASVQPLPQKTTKDNKVTLVQGKRQDTFNIMLGGEVIGEASINQGEDYDTESDPSYTYLERVDIGEKIQE